MQKIGMVRRSQERIRLDDIGNENQMKIRNNINLSGIQSNNANSGQGKLGYINYSQPNSSRQQSLGQVLAQNNNTQSYQQLGVSFLQQNGGTYSQLNINNSNSISNLVNNSINVSSIIRHGSIASTRAVAQQFLQQNNGKNEDLKVTHSLPVLFNSQNNSLIVQQPLQPTQSQNIIPMNSEIINRSLLQDKQPRSRLNHSNSQVSISSQANKATNKRSFYHHTNIFNIKQYKNLTDHIIDGTDIDEIKNNQKSILIREFRYKVDQYLLFSKYRQEQATKEFNSYYSKIQDQLFKTDGYEQHKLFMKGQSTAAQNGGISFFTSNNEDNNQSLSIIQPELNKSLLNIDANRFNYQKLSKEEASMIHNINVDIYLEDSLGKQRHTTHKFNHTKLQDYVLDKMKPYLSNDKEYDKKIEFFTQEYERILEKIQTRSFKIKVPKSYVPQMSAFNEYYKIDPSKIRESQMLFSWQEIENNILGQVIEDSDFKEISYDNEDNEFDEKEEYEEEKDENEKSNEDESEKEEENEERERLEQEVDELQPVERLKSSKVIKNEPTKEKTTTKKEKQQKQQALQIFGEEVKVKQVMKIVKKKKKKNKDTEVDTEENNENQDRKTKITEQIAKGKKQKNDQDRERSAMEEYMLMRSAQPPTQQEPSQRSVKKPPPQQYKKVAQQMVGTPKAKPKTIPQQAPQIERIASQGNQSMDQGNTNNSIIKSSHSDTSEEEVMIIQEEIIQHPAITIKEPQMDKKVSKEDKPNEDNNEPQKTTDQPKKQGNNATALDMSTTPKSKRVIQPQQAKSPSNKQIPDSTPREKKGTSSSIHKKTSTSRTEVVSQRFKTEESKNDQTHEEEDVEEEILIQQEENQDEEEIEDQISIDEDVDDAAPEIPLKTHESNKTTSRSTIRDAKPTVVSNTPQAPRQEPQISQIREQRQQMTPKAQQDSPAARQETLFSYFGDKVKSKVGTGLIDDLVRYNYLLDFNVDGYKKERRLPDVPSDLQFKQEQDRALFDAIFKWQYELDLDIADLEAKMETSPGNQKHNQDDSDDDDDYERNNDKSSVHSSDITDFGQPEPDKNSLNNISSDNISDVE